MTVFTEAAKLTSVMTVDYNYFIFANNTFFFLKHKIISYSQIALDNQGSNPDAEADEVVLFKKTTGSGGTGVFFKNQTDSNNVDELVSKKKAITFGLIF